MDKAAAPRASLGTAPSGFRPCPPLPLQNIPGAAHGQLLAVAHRPRLPPIFKKFLLGHPGQPNSQAYSPRLGRSSTAGAAPPRPPGLRPLWPHGHGPPHMANQQKAAAPKPSKQPPARFKQQTQGYPLPSTKKPPGGRFGGLWVARSDRRNTQPQAYGVKHFGNRV